MGLQLEFYLSINNGSTAPRHRGLVAGLFIAFLWGTIYLTATPAYFGKRG